MTDAHEIRFRVYRVYLPSRAPSTSTDLTSKSQKDDMTSAESQNTDQHAFGRASTDGFVDFSHSTNLGRGCRAWQIPSRWLPRAISALLRLNWTLT